MRYKRFVVALTVAAGLVSAGPAVAASTGTVTATGTGQTNVIPSNRHSNASIAAAVNAARLAAIKGAFSEAREYAQQYAAAGGLTLGAVLSVTDAQNGGFGPGAFYGPFGPNQYCGQVQQPVFKQVHGHRHRTGFKSVRRCIVPPFAFVTISVTYSAS
jgi:hypothetical protein